MPFSTYAGSPAMHISAAFVFVFEILVLWFQNSLSTVSISSSDVDNWTWGNADLRALPKRISSLEFMGFLCNLLCSIYNMYAKTVFQTGFIDFERSLITWDM